MSYSHNSLRGYRLTDLGKKSLLAISSGRFEAIFSGETFTNAPSYKITYRLRLHRLAEVLVTMLGAGVVSFPWEKPNLALNEMLELDRATYYSAVEVKGIGLQGNKIRGSRATGLLLTDDAVTTVYNIGSTEEVRWDYRAEMRLKAFAQIELMQNRLALPYQDEQLRAIVFAADMRQFAVLMDNTRQLKSGFFAFSGDYQHFYFLTNDRKGETILRLLCDSGRKSVRAGRRFERGPCPGRPGLAGGKRRLYGRRPSGAPWLHLRYAAYPALRQCAGYAWAERYADLLRLSGAGAP